MSDQLRVLFLCTGNSCRSQMAEGLCRHLCRESIAAYSAGLEAHGLNPHAVAAMLEIGIDISGHCSKTIQDLGDMDFDVVVTVCGHADENCPVFTADTARIHRGFDDPPKLAASSASEKEAMVHYRRVRDEIRDFVARLPDEI